MEQSPFLETNRSSATQEFPRILRNTEVHTAFASASHLSPSWARSIQPMRPISLLEDSGIYVTQMSIAVWYRERSFVARSIEFAA